MPEPKIRCLEFFSGIGGMHFALKAASSSNPKIDFQLVEAFDININANQTYTHNFPTIVPKAANVEHLPLALYEEYDADFWLLSPPCQPFTRGGKGLDDKDARSSGLLFLIDLLKRIQRKPKYFFLENVLNFERSECRSKLVAALREFGYRVKEYLVSPLEIGIPNNRLRYYLSAVRLQEQHIERDLNSQDPSIIRSIPNHAPTAESPHSLQNYLDQNPNDLFIVPREYLSRCKNFKFDIVTPLDCYSSTFTKAYGSHQIVGTGSLLTTVALQDKSDQEAVLEARPRFFTPVEIGRLHDFPSSFSFPPTITTKQQYKLLGNSLNVKVVSLIVGEMFGFQ